MFVAILGTERTCQTDGTWNGTAPTYCMTPMPSPLLAAKVTRQQFDVGTAAGAHELTETATDAKPALGSLARRHSF